MPDAAQTHGAPCEPPHVRGRRRRGLIFLALAVGAVGFSLALQMGLNANFVADEMHLTGLEQGLLETFRESCGIIALGVLALLAGLAEPLVGAGMLVLLAAGLSGYAFVPDYLWLVLMSLLWSQGLHVWMPLPRSMALALAEPGRTGRRMGQVQAAGAAGMGVGLLAALALVKAGVRIRPLYVVAGAAALLGSAACLGIPRRLKTPGPRFVLRRKYGLFYALSFLEGWRKQIFIAFAGFLLVKRYHTPLETMLLLWVITQGIGWVASPLVGRLIDRVGERKVLALYFSCLTVFFVGYALVRSVPVLYGLFVIDNAFFVFTMALATYVGRIAPPSEHTPTLSMGVAMNHVAAVTMPLAGGLLWKYLGYQWTFLIGAVAAALSVLVALKVPPRPDGMRKPAAPAGADAAD